RHQLQAGPARTCLRDREARAAAAPDTHVPRLARYAGIRIFNGSRSATVRPDVAMTGAVYERTHSGNAVFGQLATFSPTRPPMIATTLTIFTASMFSPYSHTPAMTVPTAPMPTHVA